MMVMAMLMGKKVRRGMEEREESLFTLQSHTENLVSLVILRLFSCGLQVLIISSPLAHSTPLASCSRLPLLLSYKRRQDRAALNLCSERDAVKRRNAGYNCCCRLQQLPSLLLRNNASLPRRGDEEERRRGEQSLCHTQSTVKGPHCVCRIWPATQVQGRHNTRV